VNCKFSQEEKILSGRAVELVDSKAGRIGALLIRRVANRFLRQEFQNL